MSEEEIKNLCDKLCELIITTSDEGHNKFYAITKVEQLIRKLEK